MRLCMFRPAGQPMERGWVGRIDGERVIHLAAQTLQSFFTGGGTAREHAEFRLSAVELLAPVSRPPSVRVFESSASFGFAKSHAAAFARTAYESSFLKLFYPAQFLVGLINAQPMGFYPVEVLVNDAKRHGVAVLPVDINASTYRTTTEWVGRPGWAISDGTGEGGGDGEPLPEGCGIEERPVPVESSACVVPGRLARERWAAESATGWGVQFFAVSSRRSSSGARRFTRMRVSKSRPPSQPRKSW